MSLVRSAIRIAAVLSLKNATQAGQNVFDSRLASIDELARGQNQPVISVYTDEHQEKNGRPELNLIVETSFAHVSEAPAVDENGEPLFDKDGTPVMETGIWQPQTDEGLELMLDLMEMQIVDALTASETEAANLLGRLAIDIGFRSSQRAIFNRESAGRLAARQLFLTCKVLKDTPAGASPLPAVSEVIELMKQDAKYAPLAQGMEKFANRRKNHIAKRFCFPFGHAHHRHIAGSPPLQNREHNF